MLPNIRLGIHPKKHYALKMFLVVYFSSHFLYGFSYFPPFPFYMVSSGSSRRIHKIILMIDRLMFEIVMVVQHTIPFRTVAINACAWSYIFFNISNQSFSVPLFYWYKETSSFFVCFIDFNSSKYPSTLDDPPLMIFPPTKLRFIHLNDFVFSANLFEIFFNMLSHYFPAKFSPKSD